MSVRHPPSLAYIWAQGTLRIILNPEMMFGKDRKVACHYKSSQILGINRDCRGQCPLANIPKFYVFQVLYGYLWLYLLSGTQCVHATREPWGLMSLCI